MNNDVYNVVRFSMFTTRDLTLIADWGGVMDQEYGIGLPGDDDRDLWDAIKSEIKSREMGDKDCP